MASSGRTPTHSCPSYAGGSRAGRSTPSGVSPEQSKGAETPPSTYWSRFSWCSPGYGWPSSTWAHVVGSCPFHLPVPPSSSQQGCSQSLHPPACIDTGGCPNPAAGSCTWPCWTCWGSHRPTYQACLGPSGWRPVPQACWLHHLAWCHLQSCWGCTQSRYVIDVDTKQYWSQYGPWWTPLVTDLHLDTDHCPLDATIQPIPHPHNSLLIKSTSLQFRENCFVGDHVKGLTEAQTDNIWIVPSFTYWTPKHKEDKNLSQDQQVASSRAGTWI